MFYHLYIDVISIFCFISTHQCHNQHCETFIPLYALNFQIESCDLMWIGFCIWYKVFILLHAYTSFSSTHSLKTILSQMILALLSNGRVYFLLHPSILSVFISVVYCFNYYSFVVSIENWKLSFITCIFLSRLVIWSYLWFYVNFRIGSIPAKLGV